MGIISPTLPTPGDPRGPEEVDVRNALVAILDEFNGDIDGDNLSAALRAALGVTGSGEVRRGKSIIATEESRANTAYGTLTTPDRVQDVVLPTDGLIVVAFEGLVKNGAAANDAWVGLFVDAMLVAEDAARDTDGAPNYQRFFSGDTVVTGLTAGGTVSGDAIHGPASRMGLFAIRLAAGTYDVSLQFKSDPGGSVFAKERRLWVETRAY